MLLPELRAGNSSRRRQVTQRLLQMSPGTKPTGSSAPGDGRSRGGPMLCPKTCPLADTHTHPWTYVKPAQTLVHIYAHTHAHARTRTHARTHTHQPGSFPAVGLFMLRVVRVLDAVFRVVSIEVGWRRGRVPKVVSKKLFRHEITYSFGSSFSSLSAFFDA